MAVVKFKSGAVGNIVVSNSQNPALYGRVHIFGEMCIRDSTSVVQRLEASILFFRRGSSACRKADGSSASYSSRRRF